MWQALWPGVPPEEVPIEHVTNGVHLPSWISPEMQELYERHLGPRWREEPADETVWRLAERIPADELWRTRDRRRERLVAFARRRLRAQAVRRNEPPSNVEAAGEALDPKVLTIAFARRFASYKRPSLLFHDPDRLAALMSSATRPMQIIVAGKAHPQDEAGKLLIQQISALGRDARFRGRLIFLEDYDIEVARSLVQGADLWLNTPLRPNEASGTSGMKAAANGSLNLSTLDGWWAEAWERADRQREPVGWVIAAEEADLAPEVRDALEADALYHLLEREVVPGFYERGPDGIPRRWIGWLRSSVTQLCPFVNGHRMVREYAERYYLPALQSYRKLVADGATGARGRARLEAAWSGLAIESVEAEPVNTLRVSTPIRVRALVRLGVLAPEEVRVELYLGRVNPRGEVEDAAAVQLRPVGRADADRFTFEAEALTCRRSGAHGYTVRVRANHDGQVATFVPGLLTWAASDTTGGPGG